MPEQTAHDAVEAGDRQQVQHRRGELKEAEKRHRRPELRMGGDVDADEERHGQGQREHDIDRRAGGTDEAVLEPGAHRAAVDPDRAAGQADAAQQQEQHGKHH